MGMMRCRSTKYGQVKVRHDGRGACGPWRPTGTPAGGRSVPGGARPATTAVPRRRSGSPPRPGPATPPPPPRRRPAAAVPGGRGDRACGGATRARWGCGGDGNGPGGGPPPRPRAPPARLGPPAPVRRAHRRRRRRGPGGDPRGGGPPAPEALPVPLPPPRRDPEAGRLGQAGAHPPRAPARNRHAPAARWGRHGRLQRGQIGAIGRARPSRDRPAGQGVPPPSRHAASQRRTGRGCAPTTGRSWHLLPQPGRLDPLQPRPWPRGPRARRHQRRHRRLRHRGKRSRHADAPFPGNASEPARPSTSCSSVPART